MSPTPGAARLLYIDWLRGLAVLFMFEAHLYPAWLRPAELYSKPFQWTKIFAGYAAPLFLFLAGVGMAMAMTSALAKGRDWEATRRTALKRGGQIFLAALVFRLQEHLLGGGFAIYMLRVDILNCIGAAMLIAAAFLFPRPRGLCAWRALIAGLFVFGVTPLLYRLDLPGWMPWPIPSYLIDRREEFFPLVPWAGYLFFGLAAGTLWSRAVAPATEGQRRWVMPALGLIGATLVGGVWLLGQKLTVMALLLGGKGRDQLTYLATHVGWILIAAAVAYVLQPLANPRRFGPVRQLGKTSMLMYWVHVELVYGHVAGGYLLNFKLRLDFAGATAGLLGLTLFMLLLSWVRTHYLGALRAAALFEHLWAEVVKYLREAWRKSAVAIKREREQAQQ